MTLYGLAWAEAHDFLPLVCLFHPRKVPDTTAGCQAKHHPNAYTWYIYVYIHIYICIHTYIHIHGHISFMHAAPHLRLYARSVHTTQSASEVAPSVSTCSSERKSQRHSKYPRGSSGSSLVSHMPATVSGDQTEIETDTTNHQRTPPSMNMHAPTLQARKEPFGSDVAWCS